MLLEESLWIKEAIQNLSLSELSPMLNIGSSTIDFREKKQAYIHQNIFVPIEIKGGIVYHLDIKDADGVDIVGDLTDPNFQQRLKEEYQFSSFLCANLLEHIEEKERQKLCKAIEDMMPKGSYLILTVPHTFPYHKDPIDSMFRPNIETLKNHFPTLTLIKGDIVKTSENMFDYFDKGTETLVEYLGYITLPFLFKLSKYDWIQIVKYLPKWFKKFDCTCLILKK